MLSAYVLYQDTSLGSAVNFKTYVLAAKASGQGLAMIRMSDVPFRFVVCTLFVLFDVLLTVHLSIILVILFCNKFIIRLYMFRALCAHHQEVRIVLYSI